MIQVITIPDNRYLRYRLRPDYIQRFIFPGAHLPSLGAMKGALRRTKLRIIDREDLAPHYGPTLAVSGTGRWGVRVTEMVTGAATVGIRGRMRRERWRAK